MRVKLLSCFVAVLGTVLTVLGAGSTPIANLKLVGDANGNGSSFTNLGTVVAGTVRLTNGTDTATLTQQDISNLHGGTSTWNQASSDGINATNRLVGIESRTSIWNQVISKVDTNNTHYLNSITNFQPDVMFGQVTVTGLSNLTQLTLNGQIITYPNIATGGTITHAGGREIHTFLSSGDFILSATTTGDVLIVAGGGMGGYGEGGGGGGGGLIYTQNAIFAAASYSATVGVGGVASALTANNGNNTLFAGMIVIGGGAGGGAIGDAGLNGQNGGSGGGGCGYFYYQPGMGIDGQGNAGGTGYNDANYGAGGGGGAGSFGSNGFASVAGMGGSGVACSISGSSVFYGGGGGGGKFTDGSAGVGGSGGGGAGSVSSVGTDGTGGLGGGGGGGGNNGGAVQLGGSGGSGVVIVSLPAASPSVGPDSMHMTFTNGSFGFDRPIIAPNISTNAVGIDTNLLRIVNQEIGSVREGYVGISSGGSPKLGMLKDSGNYNWLIYRTGGGGAGQWIAYPGIARMLNGGLICMFSIGASDFDSSSAVYYMLSYDDGATWTDAIFLYKNADSSFGSGCGDITVLRDGRIFCTGRDQSSSSIQLWTLTGIPNNDGTIAWDVPRTIPNTTGQAFFVGSGPANELFDGTILIWVYVEDVGGANMKMFVLRSIDHGVSFGSPILVWDGENVIECGENSAIQVPSGLIVNVIRAQNYDSSSNRYSKVTSSDGGLTWSAPVDVIQTGASISHPSLIQTRSGALHLTGSVSTGKIVGSRPTCDWTSWDNGETWTATRPWLWPDGSNNYCDDYGGQCLLSGGNIGAVTAEIYDGYLISVYTGIFYHQYSDGYGLFSGVDAGIARLNKTVLSNGTVITDGTYNGSNAVFFTTSDGTSYALTLPPHP